MREGRTSNNAIMQESCQTGSGSSGTQYIVPPLTSGHLAPFQVHLEVQVLAFGLWCFQLHVHLNLLFFFFFFPQSRLDWSRADLLSLTTLYDVRSLLQRSDTKLPKSCGSVPLPGPNNQMAPMQVIYCASFKHQGRLTTAVHSSPRRSAVWMVILVGLSRIHD